MIAEFFVVLSYWIEFCPDSLMCANISRSNSSCYVTPLMSIWFPHQGGTHVVMSFVVCWFYWRLWRDMDKLFYILSLLGALTYFSMWNQIRIYIVNVRSLVSVAKWGFLGVLSGWLKVAGQLESLAKKAFGTLCFIRKDIEYTSWHIIMQVYRSLMRPYVCYSGLSIGKMQLSLKVCRRDSLGCYLFLQASVRGRGWIGKNYFLWSVKAEEL